MTEYRSRRERKRASGGKIPGHENHIEPALLARGGACEEPKRKRGGHVDGHEVRKHMAKRKRGGWIGPARERMEKKGTVGSLHKAMGVPQGEKIPTAKLEKAKSKAEHSGNTKMIRKIVFAENVRK